MTSPTTPGFEPEVIRYRERFVTCASCRSEARWLVDGTSSCDKHKDLWVRRALAVRAGWCRWGGHATDHKLRFTPRGVTICPDCAELSGLAVR